MPYGMSGMKMVLEAGEKKAISAPSEDTRTETKKGAKSFSTLVSTLGGES